jgi:hypothetical protein
MGASRYHRRHPIRREGNAITVVDGNVDVVTEGNWKYFAS